MKLLIFIIPLILLLGSCKEENIIPEDLAGKKKYLSTKKAELRALQNTIDDLNKEIEKLDPPKEKAPLSVEVITLESKDIQRHINVQAQVTADKVANASSSVGGRIISLRVKEGDYIKKGKVIAKTDMSTAEKQKAEIETSLSLATTVFERQNRLWKQDIGSEIQFLEAKNNKERLEMSLKTIDDQMSKKYVYAPISGYVDKVFVKQGEVAAPGMPIVQILNTGDLKVVADLQETLLSNIKKGDMVELYFPALDITTKNKISMIGRSVDPTNRTFKIEIATSSLKGKLKPNLLAEVKVNDFNQANAIAIPIEVIQEDVKGNKFVFITKPDGQKTKAVKTYIELGESSGDKAIVIIGLAAGDKLITTGGMKLSDNDLVNALETNATNE